MRLSIPRVVYLIYLLDHIPGVVAIVGMPLHFLPHDHGRLALNETPYPAFDNLLKHHFSLPFFFLLFYKVLPYLYTKGGSTLLKSRNGGRSLNISIVRYKPFTLIS